MKMLNTKYRRAQDNFIIGLMSLMPFNKCVLIGIFCLALFSCEKNIDIELPDAARKIVVDGSIEPGIPPFVILTKTEGYFDPIDINALKNSFIHDALVKVSDGTNTVELTEICTDELDTALLPSIAQLIGVSLDNLMSFGFCIYSTFDPVIFGEVGKTYALNIQAEGAVLTATTTIPEPIPMERYWYKDQPGFDNYGYLWFELNDPQAIGNSYRIYTQRLGKDDRFLPANGSVFDDKFFNGLTFEAFIFRGHETNSDDPNDSGLLRDYYQQGDTIAVKFCTIDQSHFEFLNSFEIASFNGGNPFASPATIKTNITGGIGVWGGYSPVYDTLIAVD